MTTYSEYQQHQLVYYGTKIMITKHHLIPRSKGGTNDPENLLMIEEELHHAWHLLFGNRTISQIIRMLTKIKYSPNKTIFYRRY